MLRVLIGFGVLALAPPAWAGCENYTDGSLEAPAPRARICVPGKCEETTLDYACGNSTSALSGYANGIKTEASEEGRFVWVEVGQRKIDYAPDAVTCTALDEGACVGLRSNTNGPHD